MIYDRSRGLSTGSLCKKPSLPSGGNIGWLGEAHHLPMGFDPRVLNDDEHALVRAGLRYLVLSFDQRKRHLHPLSGLRFATF